MEQPGWPTIDDVKFFKEQRKLARDRSPIGNAGIPLELAPKSKSSSRSSKKKSKSKSKSKLTPGEGPIFLICSTLGPKGVQKEGFGR